jgi:hypothetical protein
VKQNQGFSINIVFFCGNAGSLFEIEAVNA